LGALTRTHPEPQGSSVEEFLAMLSFENRSKLAELPGAYSKGGRDERF
jgi:hypothetical protein